MHAARLALLAHPQLAFGLNLSQAFAQDASVLTTGALAGQGPFVNSTGTTGLQVSSGVIVGASGSTMTTVSGAYSNDQYASVTVGTVPTSGQSVGAAARCSTSQFTCYFARAFVNGANPTQLDLFKRVNGTATLLASQAPLPSTLSPGDVISIVAEGTTITGKVNGQTLAAATDSTITSGTPGIANTGNLATITHFAAGNAATNLTSAESVIGSDNFNRANGSISTGQPLWQATPNFSSSVIPVIVSNAVVNSTGTHNTGIWNASFTTSQYSTVTIGVPFTTTIGVVSPMLRWNAGTGQGYRLPVNTDALNLVSIDRIDGGTTLTRIVTAACSGTTGTQNLLLAGSTLTGAAIGSTLYLFVNNHEVLRTTETTYPTGQVGFDLWGNATENPSVSGWSGGDIVGF